MLSCGKQGRNNKFFMASGHAITVRSRTGITLEKCIISFVLCDEAVEMWLC